MMMAKPKQDFRQCTVEVRRFSNGMLIETWIGLGHTVFRTTGDAWQVIL